MFNLLTLLNWRSLDDILELSTWSIMVYFTSLLEYGVCVFQLIWYSWSWISYYDSLRDGWFWNMLKGNNKTKGSTWWSWSILFENLPSLVGWSLGNICFNIADMFQLFLQQSHLLFRECDINECVLTWATQHDGHHIWSLSV